MTDTAILVPLKEYNEIKEKAVKADAVLALLGTEFPDATCQILSIKSILGYVEPVEEEEVPVEQPAEQPSDETNTEETNTEPTDETIEDPSATE